MKVLVTGVAGFIGSHVADCLLEAGHAVVGLDDLSGGYTENVHEEVVFIEGSVCDRGLVDRVFDEHAPQVVFHLAAFAAENLSHFMKRFTYENNLLGGVTLLNAAVRHGVELFVFTSSIAVYGDAPCPMSEALAPRPIDPYGIAKYAFELELRATSRVFGLPFVVFRPHNVYGERQNLADPHRNVVAIFIRQALGGEKLTVFGDGSQTRSFSHVATVASVIARSIEVRDCWNQTLNIGEGQACTIRALAELVADVAGVPLSVRTLPRRDEVTHAFPDTSRAAQVFGPEKTVELREGIRRMYEWAQARGIPAKARGLNLELSKDVLGSELV